MVRDLFVGNGSWHDPEGILVKAFNLPLIVSINADSDSESRKVRIQNMTAFPVLNQLGDLGSRAFGMSMIYKDYLFKNDFITSLGKILPQLIKNFIYKFKAERSVSSFQRKLPPFIIHDKRGRTFTILAYINTYYMPVNHSKKVASQVFEIDKILTNSDYSDIINSGLCPTFKWNSKFSTYDLLPPSEVNIIPKNSDIHYIKDEEFKATVENFSYTCTDALISTYIKDKLHFGIVKRINSESVVYPHWWLIGGRCPAYQTPQMSIVTYLNNDIFAKALDHEDLEKLSNLAQLNSSNIAYYEDPSRKGASKSTFNITMKVLLSPDFVKRISTLNPNEYEGEVNWVSIGEISNNLNTNTNLGDERRKIHLNSVDSEGNPLNNIELDISENAPGTALWNKLLEAKTKNELLGFTKKP